MKSLFIAGSLLMAEREPDRPLDKAVDLTDELLERLNAKFEAERKDASR